MDSIPELRLRSANDAPLRPERDYVLYWMIAARRARSNWALDRALDHAKELDKPLVVLEPLRIAYPHASDRFHVFVMEGMRANRTAFESLGATYVPYVEPEDGAGRGLLAALAKRACVVVTDDWPHLFLPRMVAAASRAVDVRLECVDSNGFLPIRQFDRAFPTAYALRRAFQKVFLDHVTRAPRVRPAARRNLQALDALPATVTRRWPQADLSDPAALARTLPIDHAVPPVPATPGGSDAARAALARFVDRNLERYAEDRNHPDLEATSGLSPWLHFGHLSTYEVLDAVLRREDWNPDRVNVGANGAREGFYGLSASAEAFLDQLLVWRELGYNFCTHVERPDRFETLPDWARETLEEHAGDPRSPRYGLAKLERAQTHDALWNAAQTQLVTEGTIHNALRMLWGKKVLEWTRSPREALKVLLHLNDKYALDGRDPNSLSGIFWVLGRYDRAWGPERPIYGKIRYMSSENSARKWKVKDYLARYGAAAQGSLF